MTILLLAIGSSGDVHPFVGLGLALQQRGHRVKILTNPFFGQLVQSVGLELVPLGTAEEFLTLRDNPDLWHFRKGFATVFDAVLRGLRPTYDAVMNHYIPGETIVASSTLGLGARVAQDKHDVPLATIHLAPAIFRSTIKPPKLPGLFMPDWLPRRCKQLLFDVGDKLVVDRMVCPGLNKFRAEVGLGPVKGIMANWWHSPRLVIGLFPKWFAPPQTDWPPQTHLTGFPLYDERGVSDMSPELGAFLAAGEAPVIFTPGSAMIHAHDFFRESVEACRRLNCRGILLSRHAGHIPANLPSNVRHFDYAPFSQVLPKAAALVHHGGIGTSAQAMKAGVKQLVMPFCHDQQDNVFRMQQLGVAGVIKQSRYQGPAVAAVLGDLLRNREMQRKCAVIQQNFAGTDPIADTCALIEQLNNKTQPPA